jgi:hypothetical protein
MPPQEFSSSTAKSMPSITSEWCPAGPESEMMAPILIGTFFVDKRKYDEKPTAISTIIAIMIVIIIRLGWFSGLLFTFHIPYNVLEINTFQVGEHFGQYRRNANMNPLIAGAMRRLLSRKERFNPVLPCKIIFAPLSPKSFGK